MIERYNYTINECDYKIRNTSGSLRVRYQENYSNKDVNRSYPPDELRLAFVILR